jgi:hypothetical protein
VNTFIQAGSVDVLAHGLAIFAIAYYTQLNIAESILDASERFQKEYRSLFCGETAYGDHLKRLVSVWERGRRISLYARSAWNDVDPLGRHAELNNLPLHVAGHDYYVVHKRKFAAVRVAPSGEARLRGYVITVRVRNKRDLESAAHRQGGHSHLQVFTENDLDIVNSQPQA